MVISLGTLRASSLPCYGYRQNSAPYLCSLAGSSLFFDHAYATASKTLDATGSILTSLYPQSHGMTIPFASVLDSQISTIPQEFYTHGYQTYFLGTLGDPHIPLSLGYGKGFEHSYNADNPIAWMTTIQSIRQTKNLSDKKFFMYLHTYDAHEPYIPADATIRKFYNGSYWVPISHEALCRHTYEKLTAIHPDRFTKVFTAESYCAALSAYQKQYSGTEKDFDETYTITDDVYWQQFDVLPDSEKAKYIRAVYAAAIYELDEKLKMFFAFAKQSGLLNRTLVVITSDHGDEIYEHGEFSHGVTLYDEVIHVPLLVMMPGVTPRHIAKLVSSVDIMPTILGSVGLPIPEKISGVNVLSGAGHKMILAQHVLDHFVAAITIDYKLLTLTLGNRSGHELYNLSTDPDEQRNLAFHQSSMIAKLLHMQRVLQARLPVAGSSHNQLPSWLNDEQRERLIRTGYF